MIKDIHYKEWIRHEGKKLRKLVFISKQKIEYPLRQNDGSNRHKCVLQLDIVITNTFQHRMTGFFEVNENKRKESFIFPWILKNGNNQLHDRLNDLRIECTTLEAEKDALIEKV